jgi:hypothetical protein
VGLEVQVQLEEVQVLHQVIVQVHQEAVLLVIVQVHQEVQAEVHQVLVHQAEAVLVVVQEVHQEEDN